jgi:hypothetical protein
MTIHDHFDGSAHCVECQGPCLLTGEDRTVTELARHIMEFFAYAHGSWIPEFIRQTLQNLLGDRFAEFHARATANNPKRAS